MNGLHILMVGDLVPWCPGGGGASVTPYKLAEALAGLGHHLTYVALAPEDYRREVPWGRVVYASPGNRLLTPLLQYLLTARSLRGYDLVHTHGIEGLGYALDRAIAGRIKLVNGMYLSRLRKLPLWLNSPLALHMYLPCRLADLVIAITEYNKASMHSAFGISEAKIRVMYGGVDRSFLEVGRETEADVPKSLLFCGRLTSPRHEKGLDVLIAALPMVLHDHDIQLTVIGSGGMVTTYQTLAARLGVGRHIDFIDFVQHHQMPDCYAAADLFVAPSRWEAFGLVIAEAMASGLPVVATRVGGIPELVVDGETGLLVPPDDPPALAEAIIELLDDPERMNQMGEKGRERVREHFTWDKVAERVVGFYQEIL